MNLLCALYYIYIYTGDALRVWPMFINSSDLIGQLIMNVLNIYILHAVELSQT